MKTNKELVYFPSWMAGREGYSERIFQIFNEYHHAEGLRVTEQRLAILTFLLQSDRHVSEDDIYKALKDKGIGRITVFRTIKMLEDCHLIEPVTDARGAIRYEVNKERPHHDHLVCVDCNRIFEVQWPLVEKTQEKACKQMGFQILHHRHEIFGRCRDCQKKTA